MSYCCHESLSHRFVRFLQDYQKYISDVIWGEIQGSCNPFSPPYSRKSNWEEILQKGRAPLEAGEGDLEQAYALLGRKSLLSVSALSTLEFQGT